MKKFESVRNAGVFAEVVSESEDKVVLKHEDGSEKEISRATLKRWWNEVASEEDAQDPQNELAVEKVIAEHSEAQAETSDDENGEQAGAQSAESNEHAPSNNKPARAPREHKEVEAHPLKNYLIELAVQRGCSVFSGKVQALVQIKHNGSTCLAFTFSGKGINLWMKSKAVEGIVKDYQKTNHLFDARLKLTEDNDISKLLILQVLDASISYQERAKADKEAKKNDKAAKAEPAATK